MKVALAVFLLAVICLAACSLARLRGPGADVPDGHEVLARFEAAHQPTEIDLGALYRGRLDLLDPRRALPTWHRHDHDEAVRVHAALAQCPPRLDGLADASLARALAWQAASCSAGVLDDAALALDQPPFMHPSGRSYAALALAGGHLPAHRVRAHPGVFHVLELASLDPAELPPEQRALAPLPADTWSALVRGDPVVLTPDSLVLARHGPFGLASLRLYPRGRWEAFAARAAVALVPAGPLASCARRASPGLCWEAASSPSARAALAALTVSAAALTVASALALVLLSVRARRRAHRDRIHVLRTLTHELRTPATSLQLDIEPLRAAYDELPPSCQEPLLRLSDGIARLMRVLHRTARYMALFETPGTPRDALLRPRPIPSARALFEELSEEWPPGVSLEAASPDAPLCTDPDWLGLAVRNLVENGLRHGRPPLAVTWSVAAGTLVVRVTDGGQTPQFSLRHAVRPFDRADASPGLGLGLALVDRVAQLLGGRLSHEPAPTSFVLRLPARSGS